MMREQGEGIPRIFEEMEQSYLPLPDIAADRHSFTIILRNTPIFDTGDSAWVEHVRNLTINPRQRRVLAAFKGGRFVSADYQRLNQVDRDTAYRELREMVDKGLIEGPDRSGPDARGIPGRPAWPAAQHRPLRWPLFRFPLCGRG